MNPSDYTSSFRTIAVVVSFINGERLTTRQIADKFDISMRTAQRMMERISWLLPIVRIDGVWQMVSKNDI